MKPKSLLLTKEPLIHVLPSMAVWDAFNRKHGVQSWGEKSEATDNANKEINDVTERAGRIIKRLFRLTGNLAVVGDALLLDSNTEAPFCSFTVEERSLHESQREIVVLYYRLGFYSSRDAVNEDQFSSSATATG